MGKLDSLAAVVKSAAEAQKEVDKIDNTITGFSSGLKEQKATTKKDRFDELRLLEKTLNKKFDTTNSLMLLGSKVNKPIPSISTDLPTLDYSVLGCGGIPRGRIIEIFGPESSGKTTVCLHIIAKEQKNSDNICAFIDAEHALDVNYAKKLGVNVDELLISQPDSGEQALETAEALIESRAVSLIVIDSVAALVPQAELDGEMSDANIGLQARLMSKAMRKLRGIASSNGVTVVFINQIREKVGVMFGSPEVTTGGRALKFFASVRLDVRRREIIGTKESPLGHTMEIKAVKNKVGVPLRSTKVDLLYGIGINEPADFLEYHTSLGSVVKSAKGGYYSFNGENFAQGLTEASDCVRVDTELRKAIEVRAEEIRKEQRDKDDKEKAN